MLMVSYPRDGNGYRIREGVRIASDEVGKYEGNHNHMIYMR